MRLIFSAVNINSALFKRADHTVNDLFKKHLS